VLLLLALIIASFGGPLFYHQHTNQAFSGGYTSVSVLNSYMLQACYDGDLLKVKNFIEKKRVSSNTKDAVEKRTPLQWAIVQRHVDVTKYLLDLDVRTSTTLDILNMDHKDKSGKTAKQYAIEHKRSENDDGFLILLIEWKLRKFLPIFETKSQPGSTCCWKFLRTKMMKVETRSIMDGQKLLDRYPIASETLHAELVHVSKKSGAVKWSYHVGDIHHQMRLDLKQFDNGSKGNVVVADITFEWRDASPNEHGESCCYQQTSFPIKILNKNIFTMTDAHNVHGTSDKKSAYIFLKFLYKLGAEACPGRHGVLPEYGANTPMQDQFVNHSEQALVSYLSSSDAALSLVNQLKTSLRAKGIDQYKTIKVYAAILHVHSERTTCGPCERVLLGFQKERTFDVSKRGKYKGFIEQLEYHLLKDHEIFHFKIPKASGLRCAVTMSADQLDMITHKTPTVIVRKTNCFRPSQIDISRASSNYLHTAFFQKLKFNKNSHTKPNISKRTFFSSASSSHTNTPEKNHKYNNNKDKEMSQFTELFSRLFNS
jgi:hypothetical protein